MTKLFIHYLHALNWLSWRRTSAQALCQQRFFLHIQSVRNVHRNEQCAIFERVAQFSSPMARTLNLTVLHCAAIWKIGVGFLIVFSNLIARRSIGY